jgi:hypothetical protein
LKGCQGIDGYPRALASFDPQWPVLNLALAWFGTDCRPPSYLGVMHRPLTIELIFPIRDEPSARLMSLKAECLHMAGVISEREEQAVLARASEVLARFPRPQIASSPRKERAVAHA